MTDLVQWNNCAGCMRKRSLLSEQSSYIYDYLAEFVLEWETFVVTVQGNEKRLW